VREQAADNIAAGAPRLDGRAVPSAPSAHTPGIRASGALAAALGPLGIPAALPAVLALLALSPLLGFLNVVVKRREVLAQILEVDYVSLFGIPVPVARPRWTTVESLIAVNVGGALVPISIAALMTIAEALNPRAPELLAMTAATAVVVAAVEYRSSKIVRGVGIVVPAFIPPMSSLFSALLLTWPLDLQAFAPAISYVGAVFGTLVGADVANLLTRGDEIAAWLVSIGGAGTFDGIFVSGIMSMILSALLI
jgi:Predicted membrane protein